MPKRNTYNHRKMMSPRNSFCLRLNCCSETMRVVSIYKLILYCNKNGNLLRVSLQNNILLERTIKLQQSYLKQGLHNIQ